MMLWKSNPYYSSVLLFFNPLSNLDLVVGVGVCILSNFEWTVFYYYVPYLLVCLLYAWYLLLLQTPPPCRFKADRTIINRWTRRHLPSVTLHRNRLALWLRLSCDLAINSRTTRPVRCQPCSINCLQRTTTAVHCEDQWWPSLWLAFQTLVSMRVWKDWNLFRFRKLFFSRCFLVIILRMYRVNVFELLVRKTSRILIVVCKRLRFVVFSERNGVVGSTGQQGLCFLCNF